MGSRILGRRQAAETYIDGFCPEPATLRDPARAAPRRAIPSLALLPAAVPFLGATVGSHAFRPRNFKVRISNPGIAACLDLKCH